MFKFIFIILNLLFYRRFYFDYLSIFLDILFWHCAILLVRHLINILGLIGIHCYWWAVCECSNLFRLFTIHYCIDFFVLTFYRYFYLDILSTFYLVVLSIFLVGYFIYVYYQHSIFYLLKCNISRLNKLTPIRILRGNQNELVSKHILTREF